MGVLIQKNVPIPRYGPRKEVVIDHVDRHAGVFSLVVVSLGGRTAVSARDYWGWKWGLRA